MKKKDKKKIAERNPVYPESNLTYYDVDKATGCNSKNSKQKSKDIWKTQIENHWYSWKGKIVFSRIGQSFIKYGWSRYARCNGLV